MNVDINFDHPLTLLAFLAGVAFLIYLARRPGSYDRVEEWCRSRQMRVINMDARYLPFRKGPFFLSVNGTSVFYVTVHDALGYEKHLWVRCGSLLYGMSDISVIPAD